MKKNFWLLILGLGLTSGTLLIDRFIVSVPDWLAIVCAVAAICALAAFILTNRKQK